MIQKNYYFIHGPGIWLFYKKLGNTFGPIDVLFVNISAYYFKPLFNKSNVHTPEEALNLAKDFKQKNCGMHWKFVFVLEVYGSKNTFLNSNSDYDVKNRIIFDIGETKDFNFNLKFICVILFLLLLFLTS